MHRHRIRAFVTGIGETDVPVTIFAGGQFVRYIAGVGLQTTSLGPGTTVVNAITTWGNTTGTQLLQTPVLLDNAGNMTDLVTLDGQDAPRITATLATATPTTGKLTKWASNSAPWKLDSTLTLQVVTGDGIDGLYGVGVINGRDPSKWVEGPATAVDNELPRYDGTTGKLIQGSGVLLSDAANMTGLGLLNTVDVSAVVSNQRWVYGPKTTTINAMVVWNSTGGGLVTDTTVLFQPSTNTLTGFTNLTTTNITATAITTSTVNSRDPNKWVEGPASATLNTLATYASTSGKLIGNAVTITASGGALANVTTINSIDPATWVQGPASAVSSRLATFNGSSGKIIQDGSGISAIGGAMTGVSTINGRDPARWLQGPTSSTNNGVPRFIGTTGTLATDSAVTIDGAGGVDGVTSLNGTFVPTNNWVRGPNFGTTVDRIALWNSTDGRVVKDSLVSIDSSGNISGVGLLNGQVINDIMKGAVTFFGGSTGIVPGYGLPKRASSYRVGFVAFVPVTFGDTTGTVSLQMSSDDNNGEWMVQMPNASGARALGVAGSWPNPGTFTSAGFIFSATCVVPAGSGVYGLNLNYSSSGSMTKLTGWQMWTYL